MTLPRCRPLLRVPGVVTALSAAVVVGLTGSPVVTARAQVPPVGGAMAGAVMTPTAPPPPAVLPTTADAAYFMTPRDLSGCPFATSPPPPVDASEVVAPGQPTPRAPEVPATPAGGERLGECDTVAPRGFDVPPEVTASSWIVVDLDSGDVLAARDAHGRYRPASIIKTLLASVVLDELDPEKIVTIDPGHLEGAEGSAVGVGPGGKYSVDRLLHGLLMMSGNDAALALAHELGGVDVTLEKMNAHARRLGCTDTQVASVNGLDRAGMSTSAYDMALIFRDAMTRPRFAQVVGTRSWGFPGYPAGPAAGAPDPQNPPQTMPQPSVLPDGTMVHPGFIIGNDNQLLHNYPGALGGKTGFTDDARHTFIGAAERDGRRLAAVILDATRYPTAPWEQAGKLLDAGFDAARAQPVGTLVAGVADPDPVSASRRETTSASAVAADDRRGDLGAVATYGPWLAVAASAAVVVIGAISLRRRPRRR